MKQKKVLLIVNHRKDRSPGQRFRIEQYIQYLEQHGFEIEFSNLLDEQDDKILYQKGQYFKKAQVYLKCRSIRRANVRNAQQYDLIFVFREALMTGSTRFERRLKKASGAKMIFDFDDAIWLPTVSAGNKNLAFLKNPEKTSELIALSDCIFAGNEYLANYARKHNNRVEIVPTTIDTDEYDRMDVPSDRICIGWSGSVTTIQHFEYALPFLKRIQEKYGDQVWFKVIGDANYVNEELNIQGLAWSKADEIKELSGIDIGIMPLPADEWAEGKCGLKGLQYMALEIATIMSPVGVNSEIIQQGENGFLADTEEEWVDALSKLIDDAALRKRLGTAARNTVLEHYSVLANRDKYLSVFKELTED